LFDELEGRLRTGPVAFRLELAQEGDPIDDPSAMWPDGRERVVVGRLELVRPITEAEIGDPVMMHDPTAVTDGIELSPDDQIIAARRGAYVVSVAERTGGWQRRGTRAGASPNGVPEPALGRVSRSTRTSRI
jgi:catalase